MKTGNKNGILFIDICRVRNRELHSNTGLGVLCANRNSVRFIRILEQYITTKQSI